MLYIVVFWLGRIKKISKLIYAVKRGLLELLNGWGLRIRDLLDGCRLVENNDKGQNLEVRTKPPWVWQTIRLPWNPINESFSKFGTGTVCRKKKKYTVLSWIVCEYYCSWEKNTNRRGFGVSGIKFYILERSTYHYAQRWISPENAKQQSRKCNWYSHFFK